MKRTFLSLAALLFVAPSAVARTPHPPRPIATASLAPQAIVLPAANGRKLPLSLWLAARPKGVILFGHGMGGTPANYAALIARWVAGGYSVIAPLSADSMANPHHSSIDLQTGFGLRVEDLMMARGYIAQRFAGQKVILAGHSYGSLFALAGAGAITPAGPLGGPPVSAIMAFSTPGKIRGVVTPTTYARVTAPLLLITGTADTVPGFVPDASEHRFPFDSSAAGGKLLVTVVDGTHGIANTPVDRAFDPVVRLSLTFLDAVVAREPAARRRLAAARSTPLYTLERR